MFCWCCVFSGLHSQAQVPALRFGQMPILTAVGTGALAVWRGPLRLSSGLGPCEFSQPHRLAGRKRGVAVFTAQRAR